MKYYETKNKFTKGFITHEDKESNNLTFNGYPADILSVDGETSKINDWATRNSLTSITKATAQSKIDALNLEPNVIL